jgi:two-component system OmpR family response regulator
LSNLLVVEDSPAIALLLRRRLEMAGHEVTVAADGRAALIWLEQAGLSDLVLADVMMPRIDGVETLERIKAAHPELPVILVTGQEVDAATREQADAVFAKPIDFDRLLRTVEELVPGDLDPDA